MFMIYSPKIPMKNNCKLPKKNIPIKIGAVPAGNEFQYINYKTKYTIDSNKIITPTKKPINVANLNIIFV